MMMVVVVCREAYPEYTVLDIKFAFNVSRLIALERERQESLCLSVATIVHAALLLLAFHRWLF